MRENVDDGEVETSEEALFPNHPCSSSNFHGSISGDLFIDDLLKNARTCTHTHTCNPPGPDLFHTHTCYHTHTQVLQSEDEDNPNNKKQDDHSSSKSERPKGNREAVRKYREKKKAHAAYLEEEVKKLRMVNQQLLVKLQRKAILEAEVLRLRSVLFDLKGKIDHELGSFPFQKQCNSTSLFKECDCGLQPSRGAIGLPCKTDSPRFLGSSLHFSVVGSGKRMEQGKENCQTSIQVPDAEAPSMDDVGALASSATQAE
ncbi:hypothetical protein UlMin_007424 [Ulmus minor]